MIPEPKKENGLRLIAIAGLLCAMFVVIDGHASTKSEIAEQTKAVDSKQPLSLDENNNETILPEPITWERLINEAGYTGRIAAAQNNFDSAQQLYQSGNTIEATQLITETLQFLPDNEATLSIRENLKALQRTIAYHSIEAVISEAKIETARKQLSHYRQEFGEDAQYESLQKVLKDRVVNPDSYALTDISPEFVENSAELDKQIAMGKAQFKAGDYDGAQETFSAIAIHHPSNPDTKIYLTEITRIKKQSAELNQKQTREVFLQNVNESWALPKIFDYEPPPKVQNTRHPIEEKLNAINVPEIHFHQTPLRQVIETLSFYALENDTENKGINMVVFNATEKDPEVNLNLRNLNLARVLDFVVRSVGYDYEMNQDAIIITPSGEAPGNALQTEFFPVSQATLIRMTHKAKPSSEKTSNAVDITFLAQAAQPEAKETIPFDDDSEQALKSFFERAGVPFSSIPGARLALTDAQIIVTHTPGNLRKIDRILKRFSEVKMVEIESKFLEVEQGTLEEFGIDWNIAGSGVVLTTQNRSLQQAFDVGAQTRNLTITTAASDTVNNIERLIPATPPNIPGIIDLGPDTIKTINLTGDPADDINIPVGAIGRYTGGIGQYEVQSIIRALSRKTGNDLMSAPKVTVLSQKTATITIAQEMVYPTSYGDIDAEVSNDVSDSGDAFGGTAVAITAGTPQNFAVRNVGVEMEVTPTVEEDNSISLVLEPKVTEFEGFVDYGGPSVAISGNTTVTVPAGFFQPIFSVRRVRTEVTIWDGATVLLGGLTREQKLEVEDKVPVLGDIPFLGKLFSSSGTSSQKRNLLIFVTANLVSPGGSPSRQNVATVPARSIYNNPKIITPGGIVERKNEE